MIVHHPKDHPYVAALAIAVVFDRRCSGRLGCVAGYAAVVARGKSCEPVNLDQRRSFDLAFTDEQIAAIMK
jgi:hypothetical protein